MRAKFVNEMSYERMSVEEFVNWYENLEAKYPNLPWYNIVSSLENDEDSTDGELYSYFISELGIENHALMNEVVSKREYFMNFEYAQHIDTN